MPVRDSPPRLLGCAYLLRHSLLLLPPPTTTTVTMTIKTTGTPGLSTVACRCTSFVDKGNNQRQMCDATNYGVLGMDGCTELGICDEETCLASGLTWTAAPGRDSMLIIAVPEFKGGLFHKQ